MENYRKSDEDGGPITKSAFISTFTAKGKRFLLLTKMDRESLGSLNTVLNRFTNSNVKVRQDRKTEALNSWQPIVEKIVEKYVKRDGRFAKLRIFPTGSYYERSKVGEPDEFDLMLVMDNLELDDDLYGEEENDGMSEPPTGEYIILN